MTSNRSNDDASRDRCSIRFAASASGRRFYRAVADFFTLNDLKTSGAGRSGVGVDSHENFASGMQLVIAAGSTSDRCPDCIDKPQRLPQSIVRVLAVACKIAWPKVSNLSADEAIEAVA